MNAFMVWSSVERKRLAKKEPRLHNTELSRRLGHIWKTMTENEKSPFRKEADMLKMKLMEEHPDYKYKPRRRKFDINCEKSLGSMKVPKNVTNGLDLSLSSLTPTTSNAASSSFCLTQEPHQFAWNGPTQLYPVQTEAYYYHSTSHVANRNQMSSQIIYGSKIYPHHDVHFLPTYEIERSPVKTLESVITHTSNSENPYRVDSNFFQESKKGLSYGDYPIETPPCSPYYTTSPTFSGSGGDTSTTNTRSSKFDVTI